MFHVKHTWRGGLCQKSMAYSNECTWRWRDLALRGGAPWRGRTEKKLG